MWGHWLVKSLRHGLKIKWASTQPDAPGECTDPRKMEIIGVRKFSFLLIAQ
jgi:hypothetical protein